MVSNKAFIAFMDGLEKLEDLKIDTFEVGKEKPSLITNEREMVSALYCGVTLQVP